MFTEKTKNILEAIQALTLVVVSIFTAYWTSKTFAHQPKSSEIKNILSYISKLESALSDLAYVQLYKTIDKTTGSTHETEIKKFYLNYNNSVAELYEIINNSVYLTEVVKIFSQGRILKGDVDKLAESDESRKDFRLELLMLRKFLVAKTSFDLSSDWKRMRKFLSL